MRKSGKNDMDSQRELLDSLMGINRNNDRHQDQVTDFRDERVCKFYLTGMCPNDIFVNTKMDEGPCEKIHSDALKSAFEKSNDLYCYDSLVERHFQSRINEADRVIKRARQRVEDEKEDESLNPDSNPDILRIHAAMSKVIAEAEAAAERGDIDTAQDLFLGKLEHLQVEKGAFMAKINEARRKSANVNDKKLRVCDVCGSFLSLYDSDKRLSDHFLGKQHIGFQYMRDALEAIRTRKEERRAKGRDRSRDRAPREQGEVLDTGRSSRDRGNSTRYSDSRERGSDYRRRDGSRDRRERDYNSRSGGDGRRGGGNRDYYGGGGRRW